MVIPLFELTPHGVEPGANTKLKPTGKREAFISGSAFQRDSRLIKNTVENDQFLIGISQKNKQRLIDGFLHRIFHIDEHFVECEASEDAPKFAMVLLKTEAYTEGSFKLSSGIVFLGLTDNIYPNVVNVVGSCEYVRPDERFESIVVYMVPRDQCFGYTYTNLRDQYEARLYWWNGEHIHHRKVEWAPTRLIW